MERHKIKERAIDISCGVLATVLDLTLFWVYFFSEPWGRGSIGIARASRKASQKAIDLAIDKEVIKRALYRASHLGLVKQRKKDKLWQITKEGKQRLTSLIPQYHKKRTWDGHLYLVAYDIPEKNRRHRDILREYLKRIGAGMLQISVWLTPYNPTETLREFIEERRLSGAVIISDIGEDGSVGEEDLGSLIRRVYHLNKLNERYREFIKGVEQSRLSKAQIAFQFLSILDDDPQLPFELLPDNWQGEKAYKIFKTVAKTL